MKRFINLLLYVVVLNLFATCSMTKPMPIQDLHSPEEKRDMVFTLPDQSTVQVASAKENWTMSTV